MGLLVGAIGFLIATAIGRGHVPKSVGIFVTRQDEPQVVYIAVALVLPGLAVAAAEIIRRWRWLGPVVVALLVAGIPSNVDQLAATTHRNEFLDRGVKREMLSTARLPGVRQLPRSIRPVPAFAPEVTLGWLLDAYDAGRLPTTPRPSPVAAAKLTLGLVLRPTSRRTSSSDCQPLTSACVLDLPRGGSVGVRGGAVAVVFTTERGVQSPPVTYAPGFLSPMGIALTTSIPISIQVAPARDPRQESAPPVALCKTVKSTSG